MRIRRAIAWIPIAAGLVLLALGAREAVDSRLGQTEAALSWRDLERAGPSQPPVKYVPQTGEALARLSIPRLGSEWFVLEGTAARTLRLGPGHMTGSAMPGAAGNCIIAGHRDTHFRSLKDIRRGDEIVVETLGGRFLYRVTGTSVVSPRNTASLRVSADPQLHLITCYPFYYVGSAPKRFVVSAEMEQNIQITRRPS